MATKVFLADFARDYNIVFPVDYGEIYVIDKETFEYYYMKKGNYGGPWVTIKKDENDHWFYIRLNNTSQSVPYKTLQDCIDAAYSDMLCSKY